MRRGERGAGRLFLPTYTDRNGQKRKSKVWCFRIGVGGRKITTSTGCSNKRDAEKWRLQKLAALGRGDRVSLRSDRVLVDDLLAMVKAEFELNRMPSLRTFSPRAKLILAHFAGCRAQDITADRLTTFAQRLRADGYAASTINLSLLLLSRGFTLAIRAGRLISKPYFPMLRLDNARRGFFERHEADAIKAHLPMELRPLLEVGYVTGWRVSELLSRQWRHVDCDGGWLRLDPGEAKNREGRMFPLFPELRDVLSDQRRRTSELESRLGRVIPWVFHLEGERLHSIRHQWEAARKAAGLPSRLFHDLRRTAVRNLERRGVSRSVAMRLVGLKTEAIYRRYAIVAEADLVEAGAKLGGLMAPAGPVVVSIGKKNA